MILTIGIAIMTASLLCIIFVIVWIFKYPNHRETVEAMITKTTPNFGGMLKFWGILFLIGLAIAIVGGMR